MALLGNCRISFNLFDELKVALVISQQTHQINLSNERANPPVSTYLQSLVYHPGRRTPGLKPRNPEGRTGLIGRVWVDGMRFHGALYSMMGGRICEGEGWGKGVCSETAISFSRWASRIWVQCMHWITAIIDIFLLLEVLGLPWLLRPALENSGNPHFVIAWLGPMIR